MISGDNDSKTILTIVIAIIFVFAIVVASLYAANAIQFGGGVTMRQLQLDFDNKKHNFRHYNEGDSVVMVDRITSLEISGSGRRGYTVLEFSAKPLPSANDVKYHLAPIEGWFTYDPGDYFRPIKSDFDGDITVVGDISDTFHVGDIVRIELYFDSLEVPGVWDEDPYTIEVISETIDNLYVVDIEKV